MNDKDLQRMKDMMAAFDKGAVQPEELQKIVETILALIKELKINIDRQISAVDNRAARAYDVGVSMDNFASKLEDLEIKVRKSVDNSEKRTQGQIKDMVTSFMSEIKRISSSIPNLDDLNSRVTALETEETVEEEDDSDELAIEALKKELEEIRAEMEVIRSSSKTLNITGGSIGGGTRAASVAYYDLSGSLDGVTKTFTLPKFKKIVSVHCSSTPGILRPVTDYTLNGNQITFTSQIDAASTLATGQTVVVLYGQMFGP